MPTYVLRQIGSDGGIYHPLPAATCSLRCLPAPEPTRRRQWEIHYEKSKHIIIPKRIIGAFEANIERERKRDSRFTFQLKSRKEKKINSNIFPFGFKFEFEIKLEFGLEHSTMIKIEIFYLYVCSIHF